MRCVFALLSFRVQVTLQLFVMKTLIKSWSQIMNSYESNVCCKIYTNGFPDKCMLLRFLFFDVSAVVVEHKGKVLDLKNAIKHYMNLKLSREGSQKKISW